jgi:hypothetical protein
MFKKIQEPEQSDTKDFAQLVFVEMSPRGQLDKIKWKKLTGETGWNGWPVSLTGWILMTR